MPRNAADEPSTDLPPRPPPISAPIITISMPRSTAIDPWPNPPPPTSPPVAVVTFSIAFYGPLENLTHAVRVDTPPCPEAPAPTSVEIAAVSSMALPVSHWEFAYILQAGSLFTKTPHNNPILLQGLSQSQAGFTKPSVTGPDRFRFGPV